MAAKQDSKDLSDLENHDGNYYQPGAGVPYTGRYYRKYENGITAEEGFMKNEKPDGEVKLYNEKGVVIVEAGYGQGVRHGKVVFTGEFRMSEIVLAGNPFVLAFHKTYKIWFSVARWSGRFR